MISLTPKTNALIEKMFSTNAIPGVKRILEDECGQNLPLCKNFPTESLERIRFAALKISDGNVDRLLEAVSLAQLDWRDLLMWAEFGNSLSAHEEWADQVLHSSLTK